MALRGLGSLIVCGLLLPGSALAQEISVPAERAVADPRASLQADVRSLRLPGGRSSAPVVELPELTLDALRASAPGKGQPMQVGINRSLTVGARAGMAKLAWTRNGSGHAASLVLRSPGASAVRAALRVAGAPVGFEVRFFGLADDVVFGPFGAAELAAGDLYWSPVIEGPAMGVEFYVPPGTPPDAVSISVPHVSHLFGSAKSGFRNLAHIGNSDTCEVDLACDPTKAEIGKSVAKIIFTTDLGTFMCSGSLLADTDPTTTIPYFLTAYHCVENQSEAATIVFYWFFERAACGGPDPTAVTQTPGGATFLAGAIDTDFAFLRMNSAPPAGVVYAGWSTTPASPGEPVFGVHHPAGDLKKVSLGAVTAFSAWNAGPANTHIRMSWSSGVTEGGSSGSGLFRDGTYPNQFLIGLLTGGSSFCSAPADPDFYGRMDLFFTDVRSWLDPPPAVPTLVAPTGIVNTASPTFTWNASPNAAFYYLWVNGSAGTALQQWYTAAEAGCAAGTGTCSVTPAIILPAGPAAFWVAANNTGGTSAWSAQGDFTVVPGIPIAARVVALYEVPPLGAGGTARLWALIRNTGSQAMPAAARAWYFVDGPGWAGDHWVGFASVAGLASGAQIWVSFDWVVPGGAAPGSYWYSARVYAGGPISDWSLTKFFDVTAPALPTAQAVAPYPVNGGSIARLQNATLWGYVRNNGSAPLPAGTRVWMNVSGPGLSSSWVGSTLVQDLAPGAAQWYSVAWPIPGTITPGAYKYYLQVWVPSIGAISGASPSMNFTITP